MSGDPTIISDSFDSEHPPESTPEPAPTPKELADAQAIFDRHSAAADEENLESS